MKYFNYILFVLLISACCTTEEEESSNCLEGKYNQEMALRLGDEVCFEDGNSFEIKAITDEFCCCLCVCVWEGELEVLIETTDPQGQKDSISFGSVSYININEIFSGYMISDLHFTYKDEIDALPLCEGEYEASNVELVFTISEK